MSVVILQKLKCGQYGAILCGTAFLPGKGKKSPQKRKENLHRKQRKRIEKDGMINVVLHAEFRITKSKKSGKVNVQKMHCDMNFNVIS